jgi:hypothetical protein
MSIFRRQRKEQSPALPAEQSLEEIEENPELLSAEAAVNELPPPPANSDWFYGSHEGMVTFPGPGPDDDPANHPDEDGEEGRSSDA